MRNLSIASRKAASWVVNATSKARPWLRQQPFAVKSTIKHHIYMNYCMAPAVLQAALPRGKYKISVPSTSWFPTSRRLQQSSQHPPQKKGHLHIPPWATTYCRLCRTPRSGSYVYKLNLPSDQEEERGNIQNILNRKRECANSCQSHLPSR